MKKILGIAFILVLYGGLIFFIKSEVGKSQGKTSGWDAAKSKKYANKLLAEGLLDQAAVAYEEYLNRSNVDLERRANIYFNLGKSFMKQNQFEDALAYFYKAEIGNPDSSLKREIGIQIVTCLERLGKSLDAVAAMEERVTLDENVSYEGARGEIVAKIGRRMITMGEIHDSLEGLPPYVQNRFKGEENKAQFIQQFIVNEVLLKKGISLQLQKDPLVRSQTKLAEEGFIIQKLMEEELSEELTPDPLDLKTYYEANLDKYKEGESGNETVKPFDEVATLVQQDYMTKKAEAKLQSYISSLFVTYDVQILYEPIQLNATEEPVG